MIDKTLELLSDDTFAAIDYLSGQSDPKNVINVYSELVAKLYWEKKNLANVISIGIAGIQYATFAARSQETANPDLAAELLGGAKAISYNLASFTWSGWNEPGIVIGETEKQIGLEAAKTNLRFALELSRGDLALCRAYWILGAHFLSSGLKDKASQAFDQSAEYARRAQEKEEELLSVGFSLITALLADPSDKHTQGQFAEVCATLEKSQSGQNVVAQFTTALKVFS